MTVRTFRQATMREESRACGPRQMDSD